MLEKLPIGRVDHVQGLQTATVTLVEYGDYECSRCGQAYAAIKESQKEWGNELCFIFRNFPISQIHREAQHAAEAAEAAGAQNKFWEMHDVLFENQAALENGFLVEYADKLGLDTLRFLHDVSQHIFANQIREDFLSGIRSGVNRTPTFFINSVRYDEQWNPDTLNTAIHQAVKQKHSPAKDEKYS